MAIRLQRSVEIDEVLGVEDHSLRVAVTRLGTTSLATRIAVTHDARTVAEGKMRHVFVDPATRSKRPIPPAVRSALEPFVADCE